MLAQPCAECGAKPPAYEIDVELQRRQRLGQQLIEGFNVGVGPQEPVEIEVILARFDALVPAFLTAMNRVAKSAEDSATLANAIGRTVELRAALERPLDRPFRRLWRELRAAVERLVAAETKWLETLTASTPSEAQAREREGQAELDAATAHFAVVADQTAALSEVVDANPEERLELAMRIARRAYQFDGGPGSTLLAFDRLGRERIKRVTGADKVVDQGFGLGLFMSLALSEVVLDVDRLYGAASVAYAQLKNEAALRLLVQDSSWRDHFAEADHKATKAIEHALTLHDGARDDTDHARAELLQIQDLAEGPLKFLLATILAVRQRKAFSQYGVRQIGDLLDQYGRGIEDLSIDGVSLAARHASAHQGFHCTAEGVQITHPGAEQFLTWSQLQDVSLALIETVVALNLALTCALMTAGLLGQATDTARMDELKSEDTMTAIALASGANVLGVEFFDGVCRVELTGPLDAPHGLLGAVEACLPEHVLTIELVLHKDQSTSILLVAPVFALKRRHDALPGPLGEELAYAEAMYGLTVDGAPFLKREALRSLVANAAVRAWSDEFGEGIRVLRACRDLTRRVGDTEMERVLTAVMRGMRLQVLEQHPDPATASDLQVLVRFSESRTEQLFLTM